MRKVLLRRILIASAFLAWPLVSFAHSEHSAEGFLSGFLHPALGLDHFLAMLAVGIVSAQLGGNRFWTIPCVFLASMIAGAIPGMMGKQFPLVEVAIGLSVIILGVAIVLAKEDSHVLLTAIFVSFFGIFHGHAHGLEMPGSADPSLYAFGFLVGTALIHVLGVVVGHLLCRRDNLRASLRYVGAAMAVVGVVLLVGVVA